MHPHPPAGSAPSGDVTVIRTGYLPGFRGEWHETDRAQLVYPSRGVMTVHTRHGTWVVPPLRGCWLPAFAAHRIETATGLEMHSAYCAGPLERLPGACGIVPVSALMRELILALADGTSETLPPAAREHMQALLLDHVTLQTPTPLFLPGVASARLRRIADALKADPADARTLEDWAAEVAATSRTLARAFARETGMSFTEFRRQVRLHAALQLLAQAQPVAVVAHDLGFGSATSFISMFRKATGMTPKAYFGGAPRAAGQ